MGCGIGLLLLLAGMGLFLDDKEAERRRGLGPGVALLLVGTGLFLRGAAKDLQDHAR